MQTTQSTTGLETATFRENHALDVSVKLMVDKALVPSNAATPHLSKTHQVVHSKQNMITLLGRMANPQHHSPPKKTEFGWLLYYEALFLAKDCSIKLSIQVFIDPHVMHYFHNWLTIFQDCILQTFFIYPLQQCRRPIQPKKTKNHLQWLDFKTIPRVHPTTGQPLGPTGSHWVFRTLQVDVFQCQAVLLQSSVHQVSLVFQFMIGHSIPRKYKYEMR